MTTGAVREYIVVKRRQNGLPGEVVYIAGFEDDFKDSRFAMAMQRASVQLEEQYPLRDFDTSQISPQRLGNIDGIEVITYKASEFLNPVSW